MARVSRLTAFPVKSLDGCDRNCVRLGPGGAIVGDRTYALFESDVAVDEASVAGAEIDVGDDVEIFDTIAAPSAD